MKTEFVEGKFLYKQIDKEEVIFYLKGNYIIFVITKEKQKSILQKTKHLADIVSYGMIFSSSDSYSSFIESVQRYLKNENLRLDEFNRCNFFIVKKIL